MMRLGSGSGVLGIPVVLVCLGGGCGGPRYDTPEATFETAKAAVSNYDSTTFCNCLTREARDETAAGLAMFGSSMQFGGAGAGPAAENLKVRAERVKAVLQRHGCKIQTALDTLLAMTASEEQRKRYMLALIEPIKDRNAFIGDFLRALIETAEDPDMKFIQPNARLVDLKVHSGTATATFTQTSQGQEETSPIRFEKADGQWKISKLPWLLGQPSRISRRS